LLVAAEAYRLGTKGIAVLQDSNRYSVHLDAIRTDGWYVEQGWQQLDTPVGKRWVAYFQV